MTKERLMEVVHYDKHTGVFKWKVSPANNVKIGDEIKCNDGNGYIRFQIDRKAYRAHRLAWLYEYGYMPSLIDHINQNKSDNRICNLRIADKSENAMNSKISKNNTSGYKGVHFIKATGKYSARIKNKHIGTFNTIDEAIFARKMHEGNLNENRFNRKGA